MTTKTKAARSSGNCPRANVHVGSEDKQIITRGYFWAAILYAACFGAILLHWAVFC